MHIPRKLLCAAEEEGEESRSKVVLICAQFYQREQLAYRVSVEKFDASLGMIFRIRMGF